MPCRDYEDYRVVDNTRMYQDLRDRLARIACKAMRELERLDPTNPLFQDAEAGPWFVQHQIADAAAEAERVRLAEEAAERARAKREAQKAARQARAAKAAVLARLSPADRKALGF